MVGTSSEYLPAVRRVLDEVDRQGASFDLCLYNAGMDPSEDCSTGGQTGITRDILFPEKGPDTFLSSPAELTSPKSHLCPASQHPNR
jgi:hypothetical protein